MPRSRMPVRLAALAASAACLALAACAASAEEPVPTIRPTASITSTPAGGVTLAAYGFRHAPANLFLPEGAVIDQRVDQSNNVVATFTSPSGAEIAEFLRATLPEQGWSITADGQDSLLFEDGDLHGAFTVTGDVAALTVRSDPSS